MKKINSTFPKILLLLIGLINFNSASAQYPLFKEKYTEKSDMALAKIVSDIISRKDIYNSTETQWLQRICDNYVTQGGKRYSIEEMRSIICNFSVTSIDLIPHGEIINNHWNKKTIEDCGTEEDTYYLCHNGLVLFKINCGNPARRKQPIRTGSIGLPPGNPTLPPTVVFNPTLPPAQPQTQIIYVQNNTIDLLPNPGMVNMTNVEPLNINPSPSLNIISFETNNYTTPISTQPTCPIGQELRLKEYPSGLKQWLCIGTGVVVQPGPGTDDSGIVIQPGPGTTTGGVVIQPGG